MELPRIWKVTSWSNVYDNPDVAPRGANVIVGLLGALSHMPPLVVKTPPIPHKYSQMGLLLTTESLLSCLTSRAQTGIAALFVLTLLPIVSAFLLAGAGFNILTADQMALVVLRKRFSSNSPCRLPERGPLQEILSSLTCPVYGCSTRSFHGRRSTAHVSVGQSVENSICWRLSQKEGRASSPPSTWPRRVGIRTISSDRRLAP